MLFLCLLVYVDHILQVPENSKESGKTFFVNFKNGVWHKSTSKIIESIVAHSRFGYLDETFGSLITRLLILSADFEEQCVDANAAITTQVIMIFDRSIMNLIRGLGGLFPCPKCLVPKALLSDLGLKFSLRTAEMTRMFHDAASSQKTAKASEFIYKSVSMRPVDVS
jgi:hypothetical protein